MIISNKYLLACHNYYLSYGQYNFARLIFYVHFERMQSSKDTK